MAWLKRERAQESKLRRRRIVARRSGVLAVELPDIKLRRLSHKLLLLVLHFDTVSFCYWKVVSGDYGIDMLNVFVVRICN
jgi:hypothetical protein